MIDVKAIFTDTLDALDPHYLVADSLLVEKENRERETERQNAIEKCGIHASSASGVSGTLQPATRHPAKLPPELIEAAMRTCDRHSDDEAARQAMLDDLVGAYPPADWPALLDHFTGKLVKPPKPGTSINGKDYCTATVRVPRP